MRGFLIEAVVLLLVWAVAGATNSIGFIMGNEPTIVGVVTTLLVVGTWLFVGWFAGSRSKTGFLRFAVVFWIIVAAGAPLVLWALNAAPGLTIIQGGWILPLLLFVISAPLYGVVAMLPYQAAATWTAGVGIAVLAMTLGAYLAGRRMGSRSAPPTMASSQTDRGREVF